MNLTNQKKAVLLPLGFVKHMPVKFQQSFYSHVSDITETIEDEALVDDVALFRDLVAEVLNQVNSQAISDAQEMYDLYTRAERFWQGTRHLFKGYRHSTDTKEATLATKALDIFQRMECKRLLLSNAGAKLNALATNIANAWKPAEITGTFLENWKTQLTNLANEYATALQQHVERGASHVCYTERKMDLYDAFEFLYLHLYTQMGCTGDLLLAKLFSDINDLIAWYTATAKAHATRVKNANANDNDNDNEPGGQVNDNEPGGPGRPGEDEDETEDETLSPSPSPVM